MRYEDVRQVAEAGLSVPTEDDSAGIGGVRGDDQVVRTTRCTGASYVCDESGVMSGRRLGVVQDIDRGHDRGQGSGAIRRARHGVRQLDADPVLGDRDGGDRQFVIVE